MNERCDIAYIVVLHKGKAIAFIPVLQAGIDKELLDQCQTDEDIEFLVLDEENTQKVRQLLNNGSEVDLEFFDFHLCH